MASLPYIWTCRAGFENDLAEELARAKLNGTAVDHALVSSRMPPSGLQPTFARMGFQLTHKVAWEPEAVAAALKSLAPKATTEAAGAYGLQVWVPDSDAANVRSSHLHTLVEKAQGLLGADIAPPESAPRVLADGPLIQVVGANDAEVWIGKVKQSEAVSLWPGGRARMRVAKEAPSRAAMKLAEALQWIGFGPEKGESCVDLGAAPGGWTWLLLKRGARVVAIDPAKMAPSIANDRKLRHLKGNAFEYEPDEPIDWLFCDMVWKPLEVASLLARWGKRHYARFVVSNIKLPMKDKNQFVDRVRGTLESAGWRELKMRHLYHDREEITLFARR